MCVYVLCVCVRAGVYYAIYLCIAKACLSQDGSARAQVCKYKKFFFSIYFILVFSCHCKEIWWDKIIRLQQTKQIYLNKILQVKNIESMKIKAVYFFNSAFREK